MGSGMSLMQVPASCICHWPCPYLWHFQKLAQAVHLFMHLTRARGILWVQHHSIVTQHSYSPTASNRASFQGPMITLVTAQTEVRRFGFQRHLSRCGLSPRKRCIKARAVNAAQASCPPSGIAGPAACQATGIPALSQALFQVRRKSARNAFAEGTFG